MKIRRKDLLLKLQRKQRGNRPLLKAVDKLIFDLERGSWDTPQKLKENRPDADCVHSDGFYFFNLQAHRTMILIEFDEGEATIIWVGAHDDYDRKFKGNKATIEKWLSDQELI